MTDPSGHHVQWICQGRFEQPSRICTSHERYNIWKVKQVDQISSQMFLDRGGDSFLAEVIGLVRLTRLHIDVDQERKNNWPKTVRIEFGAINPHTGNEIKEEAFGWGYGEALREIRERIREEVG